MNDLHTRGPDRLQHHDPEIQDRNSKKKISGQDHPAYTGFVKHCNRRGNRREPFTSLSSRRECWRLERAALLTRVNFAGHN